MVSSPDFLGCPFICGVRKTSSQVCCLLPFCEWPRDAYSQYTVILLRLCFFLACTWKCSFEIVSEVFTVKMQILVFLCSKTYQQITCFYRRFKHLGLTRHLQLTLNQCRRSRVTFPVEGRAVGRAASSITRLVPASLQLLHQLPKLMKNDIVGILLTTWLTPAKPQKAARGKVCPQGQE